MKAIRVKLIRVDEFEDIKVLEIVLDNSNNPQNVTYYSLQELVEVVRHYDLGWVRVISNSTQYGKEVKNKLKEHLKNKYIYFVKQK